MQSWLTFLFHAGQDFDYKDKVGFINNHILTENVAQDKVNTIGNMPIIFVRYKQVVTLTSI